MNQSALKTFAQKTRRKLRDLIGGRLDYVLSADTAELRQQAAQVNELRAALKNEGRDQLNDYVREFIGKLEEKHRQLTIVTLNESARPGDRTKAAKEISKIDKILKEIRAWERDVLLPLAQQRLEIDLDDGVKVNYLKFKGAVVNIPGLDKGEDE